MVYQVHEPPIERFLVKGGEAFWRPLGPPWTLLGCPYVSLGSTLKALKNVYQIRVCWDSLLLPKMSPAAAYVSSNNAVPQLYRIFPRPAMPMSTDQGRQQYPTLRARTFRLKNGATTYQEAQTTGPRSAHKLIKT